MTRRDNQLRVGRKISGVTLKHFVWAVVALMSLSSGLLVAGDSSTESADLKPNESQSNESDSNEAHQELSDALLEEIKVISAMDADPDYGEYLANECTSCHSPKTTDNTAVPNIYGVEKDLIITNLVMYRDGIRTNTTMTGVAGALSSDDIAALATYLADYQL